MILGIRGGGKGEMGVYYRLREVYRDLRGIELQLNLPNLIRLD